MSIPYYNMLPLLFSKPSGFVPTDIANLTVWLDASDTATITEIAGSVSAWADKSGAGNGLSQGTGTQQPITGTRTINGLNVIDFDGTDDRMNFGSGFRGAMSGSVGFTIFSVVQFDNTGTTDTIYAMNNGGSTIMAFRQESSGGMSYLGGTTLTLSRTNDTSPHVMGLRRSGVDKLVFVDGTTATNTGAVDQTFNNAVVYGFTPQGAIRFLNGNAAEFLIYTRDLSNSEINQVGNYLATKWGITWMNI